MPNHNNNSPLTIENVNKSYGQQHVLKDISFSVEKGEIFGLIGLNGAGKTTLIKTILGLLKQDSGELKLFDQSTTEPKSRQNISFLPEKFQPSHVLKGKEFLALTMSYYGKKYDNEKARQKAIELDLDPDVLSSKITKYSKGMAQKLGILSALLTDAPLLILDEPMSGLDPSARIHLKDNLMNYTKDSDNSIFFSSHILSDIDEICDRIAILHNNEVIFIGEPKEFKKIHDNDSLERSFLQAIA